MPTQHQHKEYTFGTLSKQDLHSKPLEQFKIWFSQAKQCGIEDCHAFALATADREGNPMVRTLLLRGISEQGIEFYSNANSAKGQHLLVNPKAEALFFWSQMNRQVRIRGEIALLSKQTAAAYFKRRPLGSQQASYASEQSKPIENRQQLDDKLTQIEKQHPDKVPVPDDWTGYQLQPHYWEFWQGRSKRFHDRLSYQKQSQQPPNDWKIVRLQP